MSFHGEISFKVVDKQSLEVNFCSNIPPTKVVCKGDMIALGRKSFKNIWYYKLEFTGEKEYNKKLDQMINQLYAEREYVHNLIDRYEIVDINVYIISDFAQIGYSLDNNLFEKIASIGCAINFHILSFGGALEE